jgi:hypothetical protein
MSLPDCLCEKPRPTSAIPGNSVDQAGGTPALLKVSRRHCGHQLGEPDNIEDAPEIIGKRGQAEFGTDLLQAAHQKRLLVHPLLDRAERVFDCLAAAVEDIWAFRQSGLHAVQHGFVLETRYRAKPTTRAS